MYLSLFQTQNERSNGNVNTTGRCDAGQFIALAEVSENEGLVIERSNENVNATDRHGASNFIASQPKDRTGTEISPHLNECVPLHPGTRSWEVPRGNVIIEKIIGRGAFGKVAQGKASRLPGKEETITVAIKMLPGRAYRSFGSCTFGRNNASK